MISRWCLVPSVSKAEPADPHPCACALASTHCISLGCSLVARGCRVTFTCVRPIQAIDNGELEGSMYGLRPKRDRTASRTIQPTARGEQLVQSIVAEEEEGEKQSAERKHRKVVM